MRKLIWSFIMLSCIVCTAIEMFSDEYSSSTIGQLGILCFTTPVILLQDKGKYVPICTIISWLIQCVALVMLDINLFNDGVQSENDEEVFRKNQELLAIRPMHLAVLILYVFTQGLSFKQSFYIMMPTYVI